MTAINVTLSNDCLTASVIIGVGPLSLNLVLGSDFISQSLFFEIEKEITTKSGFVLRSDHIQTTRNNPLAFEIRGLPEGYLDEISAKIKEEFQKRIPEMKFVSETCLFSKDRVEEIYYCLCDKNTSNSIKYADRNIVIEHVAGDCYEIVKRNTGKKIESTAKELFSSQKELK